MAETTSGVFTATGMSSEVSGKRVSIRLSFDGTATVDLEFLDLDGTWVAAKSYTATPSELPVIADDVIVRRWRLNATAHTDDVDYSLQATLLAT